MPDASAFRSALDFFVQLGIYDVVLPFLLVFTLVFAFLEKSRVYGTEKVGDKEIPKKNLPYSGRRRVEAKVSVSTG